MSLKRQTLEKTTKFSLGQLRACQHIGLDVDHNDVQAVLDRALGMGKADNRVSGGFYNHVKPAILHHFKDIIAKLGFCNQIFGSVHGGAGLPGPAWIKISDRTDSQAGGCGHL